MKKIFRRNQLIITALAIMIAVAGYLKYVDDKTVEDVNANVKNTEATTISDEDLLEETLKAEETVSAEDSNINSTDDIASLDSDADVQASAENESSQPGEAVLVSSSGSLTFVSEAKLNREQVRAKNKETLLQIINNTNISESEKQGAIAGLVETTQIAEKESAAEMLLAAKGFENSVVSITNGAVDVVINLTNISDVQRAQIEDVVKSKTGIAAKNISITPFKGEE